MECWDCAENPLDVAHTCVIGIVRCADGDH